MQVPDVGSAPPTQNDSSPDKPEQTQSSSTSDTTSEPTSQPSGDGSGTARLELAQYGSTWRAQVNDGFQADTGPNATPVTGSLISGANNGSLAARTEIAESKVRDSGQLRV